MDSIPNLHNKMKLTKSKLKEFIRDTIKEVAPEGWEGTVKAMKDEPEIDNPWALAHWMKNKGYKSHKESVNEARLKRGSKITYVRQFAFGKKGKETARVMAIRGNDVLLDNGQELDLRDIKFNKKKYKIESVNEAKIVNIKDLLNNPKVKQIMKRLGIRGGDSKAAAKIVQHFMRNPAALKAIGA